MTAIRTAGQGDAGAIEQLYLSAFSATEADAIAALAVSLLKIENNPGGISLVAETGDDIVGHVAFSPVSFTGNQGLRAFILSPMAVEQDYQKRRIGAELVTTGIEHLSKTGADLIFVYGDPAYYARFGFTGSAASKFLPPFVLKYPSGWQALALKESAVNESALEISCVEPLCKPELW